MLKGSDESFVPGPLSSDGRVDSSLSGTFGGGPSILYMFLSSFSTVVLHFKVLLELFIQADR